MRVWLLRSFAVVIACGSASTAAAAGLPPAHLPHRDVIKGPITLVAKAGDAWSHGTQIFTTRAYNVDAGAAGQVGLRVSYLGVDLGRLRLQFFPDAVPSSDWHFNRWEGGTQLGICTADNLAPPAPAPNVAMGPHMKNSAGMILYVNPTPNQGANAWWAPRAPGSGWRDVDPSGSGYDVRADHGGVVNYAGKGFYMFAGAPPTDALEGDIAFPGEYDGYTSNYWYNKDALVPHREWAPLAAGGEDVGAVNRFDVVIDYRPIIANRDHHRRYRVEWWFRKHRSAARLEGGPARWVTDATAADGGWMQPRKRSWECGGYRTDGTITGVDEPGFQFSAVYPYASAFGWWRPDQPEQVITIEQIVVEYAFAFGTSEVR